VTLSLGPDRCHRLQHRRRALPHVSQRSADPDRGLLVGSASRSPDPTQIAPPTYLFCSELNDLDLPRGEGSHPGGHRLLATTFPHCQLTLCVSILHLVLLDRMSSRAAGCDGVSSALHPRPGSHDRAARTSMMRPPVWTSSASKLRAGLSWTTVTSRHHGLSGSPPRFRFSSIRPSAPPAW
jgi:hypothetical protein